MKPLEQMENVAIENQIEKLKAEIKRLEAEKNKLATPQPLPKYEINTGAFVAFAVGIRDSIVNGTYHEDNDNAHYAYELIMTEVFGKDYFKWENKKVAESGR